MKKKLYIILIINIFFLIFAPMVLAATDMEECQKNCKTGSCLQISLPTLPKYSCVDLVGYVKGLYDSFLAVIGIIAAVMMMWGAFKWIAAAGSPEKIKGAQTTIFAGVSGLVLAIFSYMILYVINPQLTILKPINPDTVGRKEMGNYYCKDALALNGKFKLQGSSGTNYDIDKSATVCGKMYQYQVQDFSTKKIEVLECMGDGNCAPGTYCSPGSDTNPLAEGVYTCMDPKKRCERLTTDLHVSEGYIRGQCKNFTVNGVGKCEWPADSESAITATSLKDEERCIWRPILECPHTGGASRQRVPCSVCASDPNTTPCPDVSSAVRELLTQLTGGSVVRGECASGASGDVYQYDISRLELLPTASATDPKYIYYVKGICCQGSLIGGMGGTISECRIEN